MIVIACGSTSQERLQYSGRLYPACLPENETAVRHNITLGQQYNVGEKPTAILYTYINHHAQPPIIPQHNHSNT